MAGSRLCHDGRSEPGRPVVLRVGAVHNHSVLRRRTPGTTPRLLQGGPHRAQHRRRGRRHRRDPRLHVRLGSQRQRSSCRSRPRRVAWTGVLQRSDGEHDSLGTCPIFRCWHGTENDHYWKWPATLRQAREETTDARTRPIRGFEWTNDYYNHMNVYFSTELHEREGRRQLRLDGRHVELAARAGRPRAAAPTRSSRSTTRRRAAPHAVRRRRLPHNAAPRRRSRAAPTGTTSPTCPTSTTASRRWRSTAATTSSGYVKALTNGWHIGAGRGRGRARARVVDVERRQDADPHARAEPAGLLLRVLAPPNHRDRATTLVSGAPGTKARRPDDPLLRRRHQHPGSGRHAARFDGHHGRLTRLHFEASGLPVGSRIALVGNTTGGQRAPIQLGVADGTGAVRRRAGGHLARPRSGLVLRRRVSAERGCEVWNRPELLGRHRTDLARVACNPCSKLCSGRRATSDVTPSPGSTHIPDLELAGLWVSSDAKVGKDAGELAGLGRDLGVAATNDGDALLAFKPDCIVHTAMADHRLFEAIDDLCRFLRAGINVVSSGPVFLQYPQGVMPDSMISPSTTRRLKASRRCSSTASTPASRTTGSRWCSHRSRNGSSRCDAWRS